MWQSVECPQLRNVKWLCVAIVVACPCGLYFHIYPSWIVVGIVAAIVAMLAIRATLIQQMYNREPWNHGGHKVDFSEKE